MKVSNSIKKHFAKYTNLGEHKQSSSIILDVMPEIRRNGVLIYFKQIYIIEGLLHVNSSKKIIKFEVPLNGEIFNIKLDCNREARVLYKVNCSSKLFNLLKANVHRKDFEPLVEQEISEYNSIMTRAFKKLLYLIKYSLNEIDLDDKTLNLKEFYWSLNGETWKQIARRMCIKEGLSYSPLVLESSRAKIIQGYLNDGFDPFIALRHLHRAKKEDEPRFRWIEATIAAELAIKEFLVRKIPNVEPLVYELPSPPLTKLYGSVLESYTGIRSPMLKQLQKGIEIRNKLVHRPEEIKIDDKEAIEYVNDIERAIYHLLKILYPDDPIIGDIVNPQYKIETSIKQLD